MRRPFVAITYRSWAQNGHTWTEAKAAMGEGDNPNRLWDVLTTGLRERVSPRYRAVTPIECGRDAWGNLWVKARLEAA